jgi:hypothetical protein
MPENQLNHLPQEEAAPPPATLPEEVTAPAGAGEQVEEVVDAAPDPTTLKTQIEALEKQRKEAEEKALYWRKQKAEERASYFRDRREPERQPPPLPPDMPGIPTEPKPSDFEDYDKYVAALTDQRVKKARMEWEMDTARKEQERSAQARAESLHSKLQEGYQKYSDFEEVAFDRSAIHITPMVVDILSDCEHPADLAYYLAKNRVEGVAISKMTPTQAARAIAKLESRLEGQPSQTSTLPTQRKPITGAPPPISPVSGSKGVIHKDPEKMTQREYEAWRLSQGARKY